MWEQQPGRKRLDFGLNIGKMGQGSFCNEDHRRWVTDTVILGKFASLFFVPMIENISLQKLSTDMPNTPVNAEMCHSNSTSKVLHGFRVMHQQTELDMMQDLANVRW